MLDSEDRQFGPSLRAPAFVTSRKSGLFVPGFYSTWKKKNKGSNSQSAMEFDIPDLPPVKSRV